jgi:hypothetical protein
MTFNPIISSISIVSFSYLFGKCIDNYTSHQTYCKQLESFEKIELKRVEKDVKNDYTIKLDLVETKKK